MVRKQARPTPVREEVLDSIERRCPACGGALWVDYENRRTVSLLTESVRLRLKIRRCQNRACSRYHKPYRPGAEGRWALAEQEFGLDVMAREGQLRYRQHQTVGEIHQGLQSLGLVISERTVTNLLDRYDELVALHLSQSQRLQAVLQAQGQVILAIDGMQPDVGHEVLWLIRDCLSGEILLARSLLSAEADGPRRLPAALLTEVKGQLPVPVIAVVSDGQQSIRKAVAQALPESAHGLCHFHYLREAARPIYEADRHAKKELKKRVRGVRAIERQGEEQDDAASQVIQGYCAAVRSALTDDGRPPLVAFRSPSALTPVRHCPESGAGGGKRGLPRQLHRLSTLLHKALDETGYLWEPVQRAFAWVHATARILDNPERLSAGQVRRRLVGLLGAMQRWQGLSGDLQAAVAHFLKVTRSYWSGLFHCYEVARWRQAGNPRSGYLAVRPCRRVCPMCCGVPHPRPTTAGRPGNTAQTRVLHGRVDRGSRSRAVERSDRSPVGP